MVDLEAIQRARGRIGDIILRTPTRHDRGLSERIGASVSCKYETLQITGSFKVRGGLNKILSLCGSERARGVVAASAGNHAQGVAFGAEHVGLPATIVMPERTPQVKIDSTRALGPRVEIILHGANYDEAFAHALELQRVSGATFVHPFDDPEVIAGQGTIGIELMEALPDLEAVVVPIGGGGLIAGIATAVRALRPSVKIYGVQTESAPAMKVSFERGELTTVPQEPTLAEGISVGRPGSETFAIVRHLVEDVVTVSETAIEAAIVDRLEQGKTLIEGAAGAGIAALMGPLAPQLEGRSVAAILSGGNIDLDRLNLIIERSLARRHQLVRLRATLADRPGSLVDFLSIIAQKQGNVVRVLHDRVFGGSRFGEARVVVTLAVRNQAHLDAIEEALATADHRVVEVGEDSDPVPPAVS